METKYCESCGMPLTTKDVLGTNKDGSKNEEYCTYCYQDGEFTKDCTVEEMIDLCVPIMVKEGFVEDQARAMMEEMIPKLKRWSDTNQ